MIKSGLEFCLLNYKSGSKSLKNKNWPVLEKVTVKAQGNSYSDLLKDLKEKVSPKDLGIDTVRTRRTISGDLEILVRGQGNADRLREEIRTKSKWTEVTVHKRGTVVHITGIDPDLKEKDIVEALRNQKKDEDGNNIEVLSLRPTLIGDLETIAGGTIIGWNRCKIGARIQVQRCHRCLEPGHFARNCKRSANEEKCRTCCKTGHRAKDCQNTPHCLKCGVDGHKTDHITCPAFKDLIRKGGNKANLASYLALPKKGPAVEETNKPTNK